MKDLYATIRILKRFMQIQVPTGTQSNSTASKIEESCLYDLVKLRAWHC